MAINTGKLVVGGLAAGLVVNVVEGVVNFTILAGPMDELETALGVGEPSGAALGGFMVLGFLLGFLAVWTYAAIRPRYGPGPATAVKAGLAVWLAFYAAGGGAYWLMGIVPTNLYLIGLAYSLVMMLAAAYVGGMVYREE